MEKFFNPKSVAVFGVSNAPSNLARVIVENLIRFGFVGDIYPVGVSGGTTGGMQILRDLDGIPDTPDLAVVLVPARHVPETLEVCGRKGVVNVILESGGFSELSHDRRSLEEEIRTIAVHYGMRLIGPNCFGVINVEAGVVLPFFIIDPIHIKEGQVSLISQSGGIFYDTCMLCSVENVGLRKLVSIGNKLLTDENDILAYVLSDPSARVVGLYLENFSDGRRLMNLAAGSKKPVVVLKANRSASSGEIARFHTTAIAGDDDVADAAMRQAGVIRVTNFQEMVDCFKIFSMPLLTGKRLALISRSGGHGVLCADAARRYGFDFARFTEKFFRQIVEKKLNVIAATNPLDIGDVYDLDQYIPILEGALREDDVDGVVFVVTYSAESDSAKVRNFVRFTAAASLQYNKPVVLCIVTNRSEWLAVRQTADFPIFSDVDQAMKVLSWSYGHFLGKLENRPPLFGEESPQRPTEGESRHFMDAQECFSLLERYGFPVVQYHITDGRKGVEKAAKQLGYPVVLKTADGVLLHKSEAKKVFIGIDSTDELSHAIDEAGVGRYLVQKMAPPGVEVIVGGRVDREFGPVVVCGMGGIYVEVIADRSIRVAPVDDDMARTMIRELKGSLILRGVRGQRPTDMAALVDVITKVSQLLMENPGIANIDINPVIVHDEGKGCTIVDVKVEKILNKE